MRHGFALTAALCLVFLIVGCEKGTSHPPQEDKPIESKAGNPDLALALEGPGGAVTLGDDMEKARKAFPAPKDAQVIPTSMSFAIITPKGWSWAVEAGGKAFEAAERDGKVAGLALTSSAKDKDEPAKTIAKIGEPTRKSIGKTAQMYVWERGDNVRFWFSASGGPIEMGSITLIGTKDDLKLLNYRADDPDTMVKQFDLAADTLNKK